ncbi:uracil-DNA glycosylase [Citricoccus sp. NR2]|uniref:uracil-DNA glycosylase n=1 Tax=Citricoccus sp. NR2 TaxID=3004095 RepID=UPI0022DD72BD|nr:uracil-DNA glycosylase [Citricoccus sp. NR2]WBL19119.1 uracil-DNA glycosylase [Citricoccus sp. NR2]
MLISDVREPLDQGWDAVLAGHTGTFAALAETLQERQKSGEQVLPAAENILRVFRQPFDEVKVLILGQDPYPTPGHAVGMSFSVARDVRPLARSLTNIYRELHDDLGIAPAEHGDLTSWAEQGVALLNRALTVQAGTPGSHRGLGWEQITETAVRALAARDQPLVAILWGNDARRMAPVLQTGEHVLVIESAHPSPLSARRGFFGSKPFSRANEFLRAQGAEPVDWQVR